MILLSDNKKLPDEYEDVYSHSKKSRKKTPKKSAAKNKQKTKKKRTTEYVIAVVCVFLCLIVVAMCGVTIFFRSKLNKMNYSDGLGGNPDATFNYLEEENLNFNNIADPEGAETVKELIKTWSTNGGDQLYSKNVINVLLIGEDYEDGTSRSDSTILVTINKKTKKIILTSFLRDSYTYMNIEGQDRYDKTNHAYAWGGASKLMEVLSNNYKIKIDRFVTINYQSFVKAVNELGGINVMVTEAEANYMNRTTKLKGFESGSSVNLDGDHALVFARIRKLDGEEQRTERQRRLITALINSVRDSSLADVNNAIDTFLPYVTTNHTKSEIVSLGTKAITEGWLKYEIVSQVAPSETTKMGFQGYRTYTGNLDVWIVDYVKAAQELQLSLYGQTNITIDESTHVSAIDLAMGRYSYNDYDDNDYGNDDDYSFEEEESTRRNWLDYTIPDELPSYGLGDILPDITVNYDFTFNYGREDITSGQPDDDDNGQNGEDGTEAVTEEYNE